MTLAAKIMKEHFEIPIQTSDTSALDHVYHHIHNPLDSHLNPLQQSASKPAPFSKQALKNYALKGAVWLTEKATGRTKPKKPERLRRLKKILSPGDKIDFHYHSEVLNNDIPKPTLIADFETYSVWLKPRGMLSQGSKWGDHTALYRWVEMHYKPNQQSRQSWIVHRLDRATCGLMLIAHSKKMAAILSQYFELGQIHKTYQANVWGNFPATEQSIDLPVEGKKALSHVTLLESYNDACPNSHSCPTISRIKVTIETGRKHQIRYHLSQSGYPILGDRLHGNEQLDAQLASRPNLQLTAYQLDFLCPVKKIQHSFQLPSSQLDLLRF